MPASLTIDRSTFARALAQVARIVEARTTIPVLANIRLAPGDHSLTLTATDLDIEIRTTVECETTGDDPITVNARLLHDLVRKVSDGPVRLTWEDEKTVKITAGRSRVSLQAIPADQFPDLAQGEPGHRFTLVTTDLAEIIKRCEFAISTEETRFYLNGIYFHLPTEGAGPVLRGTATDGHRLACYDIAAPEGSAGMPGVIIPRKTVSELARLTKDFTGPLEISISPAKIIVTAGQTVLVSKLIDGTFPEYSRVIPRTNQNIATLDRAVLMAAVDRVQTVSSERGRAVKFSLANDLLTLSVVNPDSGSADEEIEASYDGPPIEIGFNSRYVLDMLSVMPGESLRMALNDNGSPALFRRNDEDAMLAVLMPMRV